MSDKSIGSIKDFTPNFNFIIPKFDIATWHDYMESNFRSIDALFYNLFGINNYSGEWTQLTKYTVGQVLYIGEDIKDDEETIYSGRLVKVLADHTTDNSEYFNIYYEQHPEYYELFADASTAQIYAQQAQQSAVNALQSEQKAKQSETNAKNSENVAIQKANESATSATNAKLSETNAKSSETSALNSKNAAKESQDAAKVSENNAAQSVTTQTNNFNTYNNELIATKNQGLIELENKTDDGLSALSNASDALTKAYITNCITAIPQDIKLELNNGTLTLKAGSKVYKGDGTFVTIGSDKTQTATYADAIAFYDIDNDVLSWRQKTECYSQDTAPTYTQYMLWFDTANKIVKVTSDTGATWYKCTLPVCEFTADSTKITSIDQVFNGFGYIGSTIFALPGVEGLIPNGFVGKQRNNTKFKTTSVLTQTYSAPFTDLNIRLQSDYLGITSASYYPEDNFNKTTKGVIPAVLVGKASGDSTGRIISFNPKTIFQAVDRNDTEWASTASKPSDRYVDLTIQASGTGYTAPANGYFTLQHSAGAGVISMLNTTNGLANYANILANSETRFNGWVSLTAQKGNKVNIYYTGNVGAFRFIYDEGVK